MSPTPARDAFGLTADPAAYVPRLALESALTELVDAMSGTPACAALIGEPGLGKTLLLRVLAERLEGAFDCLYVPFPRLDPAEFWAWVATALGLGRRDGDRPAVLEYARQRAADGHGLVLLVDDAGGLPLETRSALIDACRSPGFALVMTFTGNDRTRLVDLPAYVQRIELGPPMTLAETRAYVRSRLRRVDPQQVIAERLDAARMAELHEASAGVPARLHVLLDAWLRGRPVRAPSGCAAARAGTAAPDAASDAAARRRSRARALLPAAREATQPARGRDRAPAAPRRLLALRPAVRAAPRSRGRRGGVAARAGLAACGGRASARPDG